MARAIRHILFFLLCVLIAVGIGAYQERSLVDNFVADSGHEAATTLMLSDAFVATFAKERATAFSKDAAVPASLQSRALAHFAEESGETNLSVKWVGMPGLPIATPPYDQALGTSLEALAMAHEIAPMT